MSSELRLAKRIFVGAVTLALASTMGLVASTMGLVASTMGLVLGKGYEALLQGLKNMGAGSSREAGQRPDDLKEINASVWQFHCPEEGQQHEAEIIFFHGLQLENFEEAFWTTWQDVNNTVLWPRDWLGTQLPQTRILSVTYNSKATDEYAVDLYALGESLVQDIILNKDCNIGQSSPVFLVGHCLGGIVIKQFILSAMKRKGGLPPGSDDRQRIETFLSNTLGAFFFATPNGGSEAIEAFANGLSAKHKSPLLELMTVLGKNTARINEEYRQIRTNWDVKSFAIAESRPTTSLKGFDGILVKEASARQDVDDFYTSMTADHFSVCKARHMTDSTVIGQLSQFIRTVRAENTVTYQNAEERIKLQ